MKNITLTLFAAIAAIFFRSGETFAQNANPYKPDFSKPKSLPGMRLAWHDEFNKKGKPDTSKWGYEHGFIRNKELQWFQPQNANVSNGCLVVEARRERVKNPAYDSTSKD